MTVFMNCCRPDEVSEPHQPSAEMALAEVAVTRVEPKASTPAAGTPMAPALSNLRRERLALFEGHENILSSVMQLLPVIFTVKDSSTNINPKFILL